MPESKNQNLAEIMADNLATLLAIALECRQLLAEILSSIKK
jgi:hypothetical protein